MDEPHDANTSTISLPASAATGPLPSLSSLLQDSTSETTTSTIALIRQQPQEAATFMPGLAAYVTQQSHTPLPPFVESAAQPRPPNLQPQLDGLFTFPDNDVNMFTFRHSHQFQCHQASTNGTGLANNFWSDGYMPNLSQPGQPVDDALDFPLSLPFQCAPSALPMTAIPTSATSSPMLPLSAVLSSMTPSSEGLSSVTLLWPHLW
jgi:hypothetical protein